MWVISWTVLLMLAIFAFVTIFFLCAIIKELTEHIGLKNFLCFCGFVFTIVVFTFIFHDIIKW